MTTQPGCPDLMCKNGTLWEYTGKIEGQNSHEFRIVGPCPHPSHKSEHTIPGHGPLMQSVLDELHKDEAEPTVNEGPYKVEYVDTLCVPKSCRTVGPGFKGEVSYMEIAESEEAEHMNLAFREGVASCQEKIKAAKEQILEYAKDRKDSGLFRFVVDVLNNNNLL